MRGNQTTGASLAATKYGRKDLLIGISQLNEYGLMVRVLGCRAEQIQKFEKIGRLLKSVVRLIDRTFSLKNQRKMKICLESIF